MRSRLVVAVLLLLTAVFAWGLGWIAWGFARAGGTIGWGLAAATVVLLALTVWVTWREVLFGLAASRLARLDGAAAERDGQEPGAARDDRVDLADPAQRTDRRQVASDEFEAARAAIESGADGDWRAWYRMGLAYDGMRDRRHAREAVRRAIALERAGRTGL